ncbi:phenylacetaldoxime dehydratase family protein [Amycolatopsis sp. FDAARGOS 1241]|nr:phenylacetaldoxime dehydratase family protein [Amycolatopsis sp. FDAARGOS 1241]
MRVEVMDTESDETGRALTVVVAYWTSTAVHARWTFGSAWRDWWESPARLQDGVGYWRETVVSPYDRHETVYSRPNYRAGFARTPGAQLVEITHNGYFGAARGTASRFPRSTISRPRRGRRCAAKTKVIRRAAGWPRWCRTTSRSCAPASSGTSRSRTRHRTTKSPFAQAGHRHGVPGRPRRSRVRLPEAADERRRRLPTAARDFGAVRLPGVLRAGAVGGGTSHPRGDLRARDPEGPGVRAPA